MSNQQAREKELGNQASMFCQAVMRSHFKLVCVQYGEVKDCVSSGFSVNLSFVLLGVWSCFL